MAVPGAEENIIESLKQYKIAIAAVQETRYSGQGIHDKAEYTLYNSGLPDNRAREFGCGFLVSKGIEHAVLNWKAYNESLCMIRVKSQFHNITLFSVHAPTEDKPDLIKDVFYDELGTAYASAPANDVKIILGDFNAKIGKEECYAETIGRDSLHEDCNENGCKLVHFAAANNMVVRSTYFPRKDIHKGTWRFHGRTSANQIDHVLVNARFFSSITNIRSHRGTVHISDHYLVRVQYKCRISKRPRVPKSKVKKIDTDKLKTPDLCNNYVTDLNVKLESMDNWEEMDVDEMEKAIRTSITTAASSTLGEKPAPTKNAWFDDDCRIAVQNKKEAFNKYLQRPTRSSQSNYRNICRETTRLIRAKKRQLLKNEIEMIDSKSKNNETRQLYKMVNNMRPETRQSQLRIRDISGDNILTSPDEVMTRWSNYFSELLNTTTAEALTLPSNAANRDHIPEPTYEEVAGAIGKLKNYKAPGEDGVAGELLKTGGEVLWRHIYDLILKIWRDETLPANWRVGIICPIFKKGDKLDCKNYRGITLLNTSYKILSILLYDRLIVFAEEILGDYQCGFRPGRSTIDQLFTIRQILEKAWEHCLNVYQLFIDFKQAYDSVDRTAMYVILNDLGIPEKLINLIKCTLTGSKGRVVLNGYLSDVFDIDTGLRQGDGLSGVTFNLVLE